MPSHDVEEFLLTYDGGEIIEKIKNLLAAAQFIIGAEKRTLEKTFSKILRRLSRLSSLIVLRYYEELKLQQIAAQTGVSLGTVKSRLHYAMQCLEKLLPGEMNLSAAKGTQIQSPR